VVLPTHIFKLAQLLLFGSVRHKGLWYRNFLNMVQQSCMRVPLGIDKVEVIETTTIRKDLRCLVLPNSEDSSRESRKLQVILLLVNLPFCRC
jgi:hypothetical protein